MMDTTNYVAYSPTTAAKVAEVSRPTIYRWMRMEGFPVAHIGGCTRIPAEAFKRWLNQKAGVSESA